MSHMLEINAQGQANFAYTGAEPWHGLGVKVRPDLTPEQMLDAAGLNWTVEKRQLFAPGLDGVLTPVPDQFSLTRTTDGKHLSIAGKRYIPNQNKTAFDFFHKFVEAGKMTMETAGSIDEGRRVFALARMAQVDFALANDDKIEGYLLLCNPHVIGLPVQYLFTPVRVVCHNTYTAALNQAAGQTEGRFKMPHTRTFTADVAKQAEQALGLSAEAMKTYKETAEFLASKKATEDKVEEFFARLYQPTLAEDGEYNRNMVRLMDVHQTQPGRAMSEGTWWTAFNAVTYFQDHITGRSANNRMKSNWFGNGAVLKRNAITMAVEYAKLA